MFFLVLCAIQPFAVAHSTLCWNIVVFHGMFQFHSVHLIVVVAVVVFGFRFHYYSLEVIQ